MDFGTYLASVREAKGWSLRDLERRARDLNHVYIWRLEKGGRENPSSEAMEKLVRALELSTREVQLVQLLLKTPIDDVLFQLIQERSDIPIDDVEPVATMSFRGKRPSDRDAWLRAIDMVRSFA